MNITLYGKQSSLFNYMKAIMLNTANRAHINISINEKCDLNDIVENNITSIPAYELNDVISERGQKQLSSFIREIQFSILQQSNFGDMNRIIVPTNFTKTSETATNYALYIAKKNKSVIHLVHAYHPSPIEVDSGLLDYDIMKIREDKLDKYTSQLNETWINYDNEPLIDSHFQLGLAADVIKQFSQDIENSWIVMGSSDDNPIAKNIFGSVSTSVATGAKCPVFIVPVDYELKPIEKIGFCISDDSMDESVIKNVSDLAHLFNAEIHLIHIKKGKENVNETKLIKLFSKHYHKELISYKGIETMNMVDGINIYSEAADLDIIAMNRGKRGLFQEMFHRSFTKRMAISTRIPLFVIQ